MKNIKGLFAILLSIFMIIAVGCGKDTTLDGAPDAKSDGREYSKTSGDTDNYSYSSNDIQGNDYSADWSSLDESVDDESENELEEGQVDSHMNPQFDLPADYTLVEESANRKVYRNKLKTATLEVITGDIWNLSLEDTLNEMSDVTWTNSDSISDVQGYPVNSSMGVFYPEGKPEVVDGIPQVDPGTLRYFVLEVTDTENEERCIVKLEMDTYLISLYDFCRAMGSAGSIYLKERTTEEIVESQNIQKELSQMYSNLPEMDGYTCEAMFILLESMAEEFAAQFGENFSLNLN